MRNKGKKIDRVISSGLALLMIFSLAACKTGKTGDKNNPSPEPPDTSAPIVTFAQPSPGYILKAEPKLVVGCDFFSGEFSPFFAKATSDRQVAEDMTQLLLVKSDRAGNIIRGGIGGQATAYNGLDYFYSGPADIDIVLNPDGTTDYNIALRPDLLFSDGFPVTIDDVIFSMYVYLDPAYDGPAAFSSLPVAGLSSYRAGVSPEIYDKYKLIAESIIAAGPFNTDFSTWTQSQQEAFWGEYLDNAGFIFVQEIVDYFVEKYPSFLEVVYNDEVALGMYLRGFADFDENGVFVTLNGMEYDLKNGQRPSVSDFWDEFLTEYGFDLSNDGINKEKIGSDIKKLAVDSFVAGEGSSDPEAGGDPSGIPGIKKTGPFSCTVTTDYFDASFIHKFAIAIAPLHYYGNAELYDYDQNMFGFPKGDLSSVKTVTASPMGAGPYTFLSYDSGVVSFKANENYYKGEPKTRFIDFREVGESEKIDGILSGSLDISAPAYTGALSGIIKECNANGELTGDRLTTITYDFPGYGYIGINAEAVKVGGNPGSRDSKNLRAAFATLFAAYRDLTNTSYFSEMASTIQYPLSKTSWLSPQLNEPGYRVAFSVDVGGKEIFSDAMDAKAKEAAALDAAIGFFKAAGYVWDENSDRFTGTPSGAGLSYEVIIPAGGAGDHPAYGVLTAAKVALASIGITLEINDIADTNNFWKAVESGKADMWAAAWEVSADPDMYPYYHSSNIPYVGGTRSNYYAIGDESLDALIVESRESYDPALRKSIFNQCLDIILDWAVEVPLYQRKEVVVFSTGRVNPDTVTPDITSFWTWSNDLELLEVR